MFLTPRAKRPYYGLWFALKTELLPLGAFSQARSKLGNIESPSKERFSLLAFNPVSLHRWARPKQIGELLKSTRSMRLLSVGQPPI